MKHVLLTLITLLFVQFVSAERADASVLRFGVEPTVIKLQDIAMRGPRGEPLYLGYLIEIEYFGLGINIEDMGYVIGIEGRDDGWFPVPDAQKTMMAKKAGLLPNSFPEYVIDYRHLFIGYSLWIFLGCLFSWLLIHMFLRASKQTYSR